MENKKTNQKRISKKVLLQAIAEKGVDKKIVDSLGRANIDAITFVNDSGDFMYAAVVATPRERCATRASEDRAEDSIENEGEDDEIESRGRRCRSA